MPVNRALDAYTTFGNKVFGKPRWFHERSLLYLPRPKYSTNRMERATKDIIRDMSENNNGEELFKSDGYHCKT